MQQFIATKRKRMLVSLAIALGAIGVGQLALAEGERSPKAPSGDAGLIYLEPDGEAPPTQPNTGDPWGIYLEPVAGLTTARHPAPRAVSIPVGTVLRFTQAIPWGMYVEWNVLSLADGSSDDIRGTREDSLDVSSADIGETLRCPADTVGSLTVSARLFAADGSIVRENTRTLTILDVSLEDITVEPIQVRVDLVDLHEGLTNDETVELFFSPNSIAELYELTDGFGDPLDSRKSQRRKMRDIPRRFATSVNRTIEFQVAVNPVGVAPLIEWKINGEPVQLGALITKRSSSAESYSVSVGPIDRLEQVDMDIYRVEITSHQDMVDIVQESAPITFKAVTHPPGFEDKITWLSSTKYGTGSPVVGHGPSFTVTFEDTFGDDPVNGYRQWLGVKADNTVFGQDQKPPDCCDEGIDPFGTNATIPSSITFGSPDVPGIPAGFFGTGSDFLTAACIGGANKGLPCGDPADCPDGQCNGHVEMVGVPRADLSGVQCDTADTFVRRLGPVICPDPFPSACVPVGIEIVGLSLTGTAPITVTFGGGSPESWLVALGMSPIQQPGVLNATLETADGGTYTATLPVNVIVVFVRESAVMNPDPLVDIKQLTTTVDMGLPTPAPWTRIIPTDGGFFCPPVGFDIGNEFFPGEPGSAPASVASDPEGVDCDTCLSCSGSGCHGVPASHMHCVCRPVPCMSTCEYGFVIRIPLPFCVGSIAPKPLASPFACNTTFPDADCCGSPGIPPGLIGLFPCPFGGLELVVYANSVLCVP